ncbi:hypothetical protein MBLNU459_g3667t1 [Dothideomycetes sp. NU459]
MAPKGGSKGGKGAKESDKAGAGKVKGGNIGVNNQGSAFANSQLNFSSTAQSINVRHILCEKHAKKEEAVAKLNAGVKFDEVAREFSEDKARQGGSLGWKSRGDLLPEFGNVAFELESSTTGNPKWAEVKTSEGYHLVMVEGRK